MRRARERVDGGGALQPVGELLLAPPHAGDEEREHEQIEHQAGVEADGVDGLVGNDQRDCEIQGRPRQRQQRGFGRGEVGDHGDGPHIEERGAAIGFCVAMITDTIVMPRKLTGPAI